MKFLVIDDEEIIRLALMRAAKRCGHTIFEASNGLDGLEIWQKEAPDCVFLDVLMPGLSGPEVIEKVSPSNQAKIILISAYTGEYNLEKARNLGADLFIPKPFQDIFDLIHKAEELVDGG